MLDAVRQLVLREARVQPVVLVFEDLHWIDSETQALLDGLGESLASARLMLLVNYRPEYRPSWSSKTYYSRLRLDALPPESAGEMLDSLLGNAAALDPLKALLVRRGNPFFLEETVRTLVETKVLVGERGQYQVTRPIQTIQVPPTVQTMLAARIDRLASEDKRLLQTAAVVGKDVPWALLLAIAGESEDNLRRGLDRLQAAEFLYQTGLFPELEYSFKHALTHEVTYNGLLRERRRDLHAHIVAAIKSAQDDRREAEIDRLAEHALRGELSEKAVYYLRQAGFRAIKRSAFKEAVAQFDQALDILNSLPDSQSNLEQAFDIRLDLRPVLNPLGETRKSLERTREAEQIAERLDDNHRRGRVCCFITNSHSLAGDLDEALLSGTRALKLADQLNDLRLKIPTTTRIWSKRITGGVMTSA